MNSTETVIEANHLQKNTFKDLFKYRELFYFLAWRDIVVRYKQAFLGVAWAVLRPLLNMAVFVFLFGKLAKLPSDHVNYGAFVLAGLLPWQLFANTSIDTCNSLVNNATLISKIYFPRMIIPASEIVVHLFDFAIGFVLLFLLSIFTGSINWVTLPFIIPFFIIILTICLGTGFWLSALTVKFRDFRMLVPFFMQFGLFISPVGYGSAIVPSEWQWLYSLNPIAGVIDGFRFSFFGIYHPNIVYSVSSTVLFAFLLLLTGIRYFKKMEPSFADQI